MVRRGLTELLNEAEGMAVVGQAATAAQAMARIPALQTIRTAPSRKS